MDVAAPSDVRVGDQLPPLTVPVSTALIVAGAIATRDFQDVHHDRARAVEFGSPDVFMNIHTTTGLVSRFLTDWAGPAARLTSIRIRLGVPNYPGDQLTITGDVTAVEGGVIEVALAGANARGNHVTGTARLVLPSRGAST
jgi:MaoC like domain